ncbi:2598_t:CDS:2 [Paraglomus occultum]|uniref:2598_t:CDS:1 n=1 Tax=Paraglomus occultum TaxID=144539 RepID=A0A9N9FUU8_9GLOM|nr:2598_t:CDS:2 [Paraglomus occultum]
MRAFRKQFSSKNDWVSSLAVNSPTPEASDPSITSPRKKVVFEQYVKLL